MSARPLRKREFCITFRREVHQRLSVGQQSSVHFINHLSPLVRWITQVNQDRAHSVFNVSAVKLHHPDLPPGDFCYRIERWKISGISVRESLAYGVRSLAGGENYPAEESETIVQQILRKGRDWDYVDCDRETLVHANELLEKELEDRFSTEVDKLHAENETLYQIKVQRVRAIFDRRISQDQQRLRTLREAERDPRIIRATEGRLRVAQENRDRRILELEEKSKMDMDQSPIAAGIFQVSEA